MEQARIEHAPNGSLLTYITSASALVNYITCCLSVHMYLSGHPSDFFQFHLHINKRIHIYARFISSVCLFAIICFLPFFFLFYQITHGLVAIDLQPYVEHPSRISQKNPHTLVYLCHGVCALGLSFTFPCQRVFWLLTF